MNKSLFSSNKTDWETPQVLFNKLDAVFHFDLDVCATPENAKCKRYFTLEQDGLKQEWRGVCWMNPPYGREIENWLSKASKASIDGATVVCLLPARTDTQWFHKYCIPGEIHFLKGRLKFVGAKHSAPFPSMIVVFRPQVKWAI